MRRQDAHDLLHRHVAPVADHDEVDEVVDVRQAVAGQAVDRYAAVQALGPDAGADLPDVGRVGVEPLDEEAVTVAEGRGQAAVAAAHVHDQAAFDAGGLQDALGILAG